MIAKNVTPCKACQMAAAAADLVTTYRVARAAVLRAFPLARSVRSPKSDRLFGDHFVVVEKPGGLPVDRWWSNPLDPLCGGSRRSAWVVAAMALMSPKAPWGSVRKPKGCSCKKTLDVIAPIG